MSRVKIQKLQDGNKIEVPKANIFKTARGDVDYDIAKNNILTFADNGLESLGVPQEYVSQARQYLGEYLNSIDKGEITGLNNSKQLVNTIGLKDYSNYTPKTSGSSFWGNKQRVWDEDALRNASVLYLTNSLENAELYKTPTDSKTTKTRRNSYDYTWSPFESDVSKAAFRGGDWDANTWNKWADADKLKYVSDSLKGKLSYLEGLNSDELSNLDFDSVHGYKDSAGYTDALRNAITNADKGVVDSAFFDSMRQIGLGNIQNWWNGNSAGNTTGEGTPWVTNPNYSKYNISGGTDSETGARIGRDSDGNSIYLVQGTDGNWNPISQYVYSNPFEVDNWNKVVYKGRLYNNIDEVSQSNPNDDLSTIYSAVEQNNKRIDPTQSYVSNDPLSERNFVSRKNSILSQNFVWEDNQLRDLISDYSNEFTGLQDSNYKLYAFTNKGNLSSGKPIQNYMIYDKATDSYNKVNVEKKNGVYFAKDVNGKNYNLGTFNNNWMPNISRDFDYQQGEGVWGENAPRITRTDFKNATYANPEDVMIRFNDLANYNYDETDAFNFIESLNKSGYNKPLTFKADALNDPNSLYRVYKPLIEKLNIQTIGTGENRSYRINISDFINYFGLRENSTLSTQAKNTKLQNINRSDYQITPEDERLIMESTGLKDISKNSAAWKKIQLRSIINKQKKQASEPSVLERFMDQGLRGFFQQGGSLAPSSIFKTNNATAQDTPQASATNYDVNSDNLASIDLFDNLTGAEKTKLVATIGDFGSIAASFIPGANLASAGVGAASSLTRFGANIAEDGFQLGDLGELGMDLALDAVSLVPGAKIAKAPKLLKSITPFLKKALPVGGLILAGGSTIANSEQLLGALDKIEKEGVTSLSTNDWRMLATALGAIASGRATLKVAGQTPGIRDFNRGTRALFYNSKPGVISGNATAKIKVGDSEFDVPVSKSIQESVQGVKKANATDFNTKVRNDINAQVDQFVKVENGKTFVQKNAPDWVKSIVKSGKTGNDWNFDTVKNKQGLWKGKEVASINQDDRTLVGGNLRRFFRPGAIDMRTAEQFDQGVNSKQFLNFNRSYQNYSQKPQSSNNPVPTTTTNTSVVPQETTKQLLGLPMIATTPNSRYNPIITPYNSAPTTQPGNMGWTPQLNKLFRNSPIGTVKETKINGQQTFLKKTNAGVEVVDPNSEEAAQALLTSYNQRSANLAKGRQSQADKKALGQEIGEAREAREKAVDRLRRISLGSEIANTREARINTKTRMTERFNTERNNNIEYEAVPRTKGKPKKQSKRTDTGIRKQEEGGTLKLALGGLFGNLFTSSPLLKGANMIGIANTPIQPVNTQTLNVPTTVNTTSVIPSGGTNSTYSVTGGSKVGDIGNSSFKLNPSSILAAGTLGLGLYQSKQAYDAARKFKPTMVDAPEVAVKTPRGNLVLEQFYRNQGNEVLRRLNRNVSSDGNLNTAMMLEGTRQANELAEKGALANDQEIKRTTEIADRTIAQNTLARNSAANQNRASLINAENMKNDLKARYIGNNWSQLLSPYLTETRNDMKQRESLGKQLNLESLNQITQQDYTNDMLDLQSRIRAAEASYKGTTPFTSSPQYRNFLIERNNLQNKVRTNLLSNQKSLLNTFKSGGTLKRLQDFNRNLLNADKDFLKSMKHSMDMSIKENKYNTKLAKNLLIKIK